jgi:uncharacterized protein YbjT (DUF2867 family)
MKTLLVLGGSGLVGQEVLKQALANPAVDRVVAPTRSPLPRHEKLANPIVDYAHLPVGADWWRADAVICSLGTTRHKAGSAQRFREVDHDYVLTAASLALGAGTETFVYNSSLGADPEARSFYLRVKGETEQSLSMLGYNSFCIVRPSLLYGGQRPDFRLGETISLWWVRHLAMVIPQRFRAVPTASVASAMLSAAFNATPGSTIIESELLHEE